MAPIYPGREPSSSGRMRLHGDRKPAGNTGSQGIPRQANAFIIGNKTFLVAINKALDAAGGFHIVGAFRMDDLKTSLRRSVMLKQTPRVAVIHEPPGERKQADDAAHSVLQNYPGCGIVLISGDELAAETERKIEVHDYNAIVLPETVVKHPKSLADGLHSAISEAGNPELIA